MRGELDVELQEVGKEVERGEVRPTNCLPLPKEIRCINMYIFQYETLAFDIPHFLGGE